MVEEIFMQSTKSRPKLPRLTVIPPPRTRVGHHLKSDVQGSGHLHVGHSEAFAWLDAWHGMSIDDVRKFEADIQTKTNDKIFGEK